MSDKEICKHLVKISLITKLSLPGLKHEKTLTVRNRHI